VAHWRCGAGWKDSSRVTASERRRSTPGSPKPRWLTGSAAQVIARRLDGFGLDLVADPESFFAAHTEGPLLDGELDRAAGWADTLAGQLISGATFLP
jgi:hypothetical protein